MNRKFYRIVLMFLFWGCFCLCACEEKQEEVELFTLTTDEARAEELPKEIPGEEPAKGVDDLCFVHICGAVRNPGVYELPQGSRIFEGVNAAGGFTEEAGIDAVNQAMPVDDGSQIRIPTMEEVAQWAEGTAGSEYSVVGEEQSHLVNINTASAEMLCTLPGVGKAKAEGIITYREQKGTFNCIEDIMKVEGIKEGLFGKIKDKITV